MNPNTVRHLLQERRRVVFSEKAAERALRIQEQIRTHAILRRHDIDTDILSHIGPLIRVSHKRKVLTGAKPGVWVRFKRAMPCGTHNVAGLGVLDTSENSVYPVIINKKTRTAEVIPPDADNFHKITYAALRALTRT